MEKYFFDLNANDIPRENKEKGLWRIWKYISIA